jgi:hypothetical protein
MVKTGGSIFIALSLVVMLLSLLPVCILFVRKVSITTALNTLRGLCFFVFLQHLTLTFIQPGSVIIQTGFKLAAFVLVFYLLKLIMISNRGKDIMNMFLVSFLSIVVTIYSIEGIMAFSGVINVLQAGILILLAFIALFQLIGNRQIELVNEPAFWIAGGLVCNYGMVLFMEVLAYDSGLPQQIQHEKSLVLLIADAVRFVFFSVAAAVANGQQVNRQ